MKKETRKKRSKERVCGLCNASEANMELIEVNIGGIKNRVCQNCYSELR